MNTYDLEATQSVAENLGNGRMYLSFSRNDMSRRVTGLQKLIQRYTVLFLTPKGSVKYHPDQGSRFINAFGADNIQTSGDIVAQFAFANYDVIAQLRWEETDDDPDDERIKSVSLLDYNIDYSEGRLYLKVRLISLAGESAELTIPTV